MNDPEVIEAFLEQDAGTVFGPSLHVENCTLKLDGWWPMAYRVSHRTILLRNEPAPTESSALADVAAALAARGLTAVGADLPAITLLTYTNFDLGYAPWVLWSTDLAAGEADLNAKATAETFLAADSPAGPFAELDNTDHARSARRLAGAPSRLLLAVGVSTEWTMALAEHLDDCRIDSRAFDEIEPSDCVSLLPTLILVDATEATGGAFLVELHGGRAMAAPVVAITTNGTMRPGVDATVDASDSPSSWVQLIRDLLR